MCLDCIWKSGDFLSKLSQFVCEISSLWNTIEQANLSVKFECDSIQDEIWYIREQDSDAKFGGKEQREEMYV
jgi:hypothetical protein